MKKHPVDELFSRKLRDAEVPPRQEAYLKLQQRLQTKQRRLGWWQQGPWLAAAGVSLLLVASWIVWHNQSPENAEVAQISPNTSTANNSSFKKTRAVPAKENSLVNIDAPIQQIAQGKTSKLQTSSLKNVQLDIVSKTQQEEIASAAELPVNQQQTTPKMPIEDTQTTIAKATHSIDEQSPVVKKVVLQLPELNESLVAENKSTNPSILEKTTSVVTESSASFDNNLINQPRKSSRMAKVWKQLKNAKNGERVDWDEVGFNPNKLLAKATGKEL
jgi:hypothetical protein